MFTEWCPISVSALGCNSDEYVGYARKIVNMLVEGRDNFTIPQYLRDFESGWLNLPAKEKRIEKVVKKIFGNFKLTK